jgi:NADPH2:quinone reductase
LLKGASIVGVFWGSHLFREPQENESNMRELMDMFEKKQIKPHIDKIYSLEEAPKALQDMMNRRVKGKLVIVP